MLRCIQEMHAEFESMRAYMLAAQDQASEWLTRLVEIAQSLRTFVENLDALLAAHGVRLHLNNQRHHSTVCFTLCMHGDAEAEAPWARRGPD